jgi:hypothetical protein
VSEPFKIVAYEPGAANVFDRATGRKVGFLLQDFAGNWSGRFVPGGRVEIKERRRRDAAARLWAERETTGESDE